MLLFCGDAAIHASAAGLAQSESTVVEPVAAAAPDVTLGRKPSRDETSSLPRTYTNASTPLPHSDPASLVFLSVLLNRPPAGSTSTTQAPMAATHVATAIQATSESAVVGKVAERAESAVAGSFHRLLLVPALHCTSYSHTHAHARVLSLMRDRALGLTAVFTFSMTRSHL